jgi:N6-adenosine-specific RNA methylase IME4
MPSARRYPIILADPPWRHEHPTFSLSRDIEEHYPTLSLEKICALPVGALAAETAMLFLWAPAPKLEEAFRVISAWGFEYRTGMVWVKHAIGLGNYVRQQHEHLLIARRGEIPTPEPANRPPSVINAPRREHSRKPDETYGIIEQMYPDLPKIELFARHAREGWACWEMRLPHEFTPPADGGGRQRQTGARLVDAPCPAPYPNGMALSPELPPLTDADLRKNHAELAKSMDPREFQKRADGLDRRVPSDKKFTDNKYKFVREAWVLAELSKLKPFVEIRLADVAEKWPDGYARTKNGEEVKIEITSAQTPGRRLGAEYRFDESKKRDSVEAPIETAEDFAAALEETIRKKVNKQNRGCALVVEQNIVNAIIKEAEKKEAIRKIKAKYSPEFQHLWILWNGKIF